MPGGHKSDLHPSLDQAIRLVEGYHHRAAPPGQARALDDPPELTPAIGRRELDAHLDGGLGRDEVTLSQVQFAGTVEIAHSPVEMERHSVFEPMA